MDSLSQALLGATVGYAVLGPKLGRRSLLICAAVGTLPDLDVLVPYAGAVESFTYHRSWSHSIFVLSLLSWPLAWILRRIFDSPNKTSVATASLGAGARSLASSYQWWLAIWLILITHILLDGFTIYGTQIFWPLPVKPVALGSIFIIDPLYTIPLIVASIIAWRSAKTKAYRSVLIGLALSTFYLAWTMTAQYWTEQRARKQLQEAAIETNHLLIAPFPTTLLWRIVAINDSHYYETFASLLDDKQLPLQFMQFNSGRASCSDAKDSWPVNRLDWFTRGAIALSRSGNDLIVSDLRMGIEDNYVFEFNVGHWIDEQYEDKTSTFEPLNIDSDRIRSMIRRVTDERVTVTQEAGQRQQGC